MGYLVTWWSPYHQQTTTASMAAVSCCMSTEEESVCVTHSQFARSDLEGVFRGRLRDNTTEDLYSNKGLSGLLLRYRLNPIISKDDVYRCAFDEDWNHVRLLSGIHHEYPLHDDEESIYRMIVGPIKDSFSYTFVDVAGGMMNGLSKNLMRASDLIVVVLSQSEHVLEDFALNGLPMIDKERGDYDFMATSEGENVPFPPYRVLIGNYNSHARALKAKNIEKRYGFAPLTIPSFVDFMNSLNEGKVSSFFVENENISKRKDDSYEFVSSTKRVAKEIRDELKKRTSNDF